MVKAINIHCNHAKAPDIQPSFRRFPLAFRLLHSAEDRTVGVEFCFGRTACLSFGARVLEDEGANACFSQP